MRPDDFDMRGKTVLETDSPICFVIISAAYMNLAVCGLIEAYADEARLVAIKGASPAEIAAVNRAIEKGLETLVLLHICSLQKFEQAAKAAVPEEGDVPVPRPVPPAGGEGAKPTAVKQAQIRPTAMAGIHAGIQAGIQEGIQCRGVGAVTNCKDAFFGGTAVLQVCIKPDSCENFLCYSAMKDTRMLRFSAQPPLEPDRRGGLLTVEGNGAAVLMERGKPDRRLSGRFILTFRRTAPPAFRMQITGPEGSPFRHDSGDIEFC